MATCKDCVGNDFCNERPFAQRNIEKRCSWFKNKADFVKNIFLNHITDLDNETLLTISHEVSKEILRREP